MCKTGCFVGTQKYRCQKFARGQFKSVICEALKKTLDISPHFIPPGHPQSNGLVEAFLACTFFRVNFPGSEFPPVAFRSSCCRPLLIALLGSPTICIGRTCIESFHRGLTKWWNFRAEASGIASCTVSHLTTIYHAGL